MKYETHKQYMLDFIKRYQKKIKEKQERIIANQERTRHNQIAIKSYHKRAKEKQAEAKEKQAYELLASCIVKARANRDQGKPMKIQEEIKYL